MVEEVKSDEKPMALYLSIQVPVQAPVLVAHDKYKQGW